MVAEARQRPARSGRRDCVSAKAACSNAGSVIAARQPREAAAIGLRRRVLRHLLRQRREIRAGRELGARCLAPSRALRPCRACRSRIRMCDTSTSSGVEYFLLPPTRYSSRARATLRSGLRSNSRACSLSILLDHLRGEQADPSRSRSWPPREARDRRPRARARAASVLLTSRLLRTAFTRCGLLANVSRLSGGMRSRSASQSPRVTTVSGLFTSTTLGIRRRPPRGDGTLRAIAESVEKYETEDVIEGRACAGRARMRGSGGRIGGHE